MDKKKILSFIAFLLSLVLMHIACNGNGGDAAGGGGIIWTGTKQLGTSSVDIAYGVAVDSSGNVYVTGFTFFGGLDGNASAGYADIFLVKYDSAGTKQWTRQMGSSSDDIAYGVAVDSNANVYVTGSTAGDLDGNTSAGGTDIVLVKYDSAGTKQWTRQMGSSSNDIAYGVAVDSSGNVYVTGATDGGLDGNTNAGGHDIFLVKYDSAGTKQWTRQLGTLLHDVANGVAVDRSGNVYVAGFTAGNLDGNSSGAGDPDIFLVKYDSAGTKQWTRQMGSSSSEMATGVAVDSSGNVYVTGFTVGGLDGNASTGNADIVLVKYDSTGTKQWTRQMGSLPDLRADGASGVVVDSNANVYVTGSTAGDLDGNTSAGGTDIVLVKYDSAGTKQWTRQIGTSLEDYGVAVAMDSGGNIYVTGSTDGGLDGNTNAGNGSDIFLVKYDSNGVKQ